jgi:hypothetical protein
LKKGTQVGKTQFSPLKVFESLKNNAEIQAKDKGLDFRFSISNDVPKLVEGMKTDWFKF